MNEPRHHPTWSEVREQYLSDPELLAMAEDLWNTIEEMKAFTAQYAPVVRDRAAERARCEATIPGYAEQRLKGADGS